MERKLGAGWIVAGAVVLVVAYCFVWPGLWVYGTTDRGMYRVNRFTGTRQDATDDGWLTTEQQLEKSRQARSEAISKEIAQLDALAKEQKVVSAHYDGSRLKILTNDAISPRIYYGPADDEEIVALLSFLEKNRVRVEED